MINNQHAWADIWEKEDKKVAGLNCSNEGITDFLCAVHNLRVESGMWRGKRPWDRDVDKILTNAGYFKPLTFFLWLACWKWLPCSINILGDVCEVDTHQECSVLQYEAIKIETREMTLSRWFIRLIVTYSIYTSLDDSDISVDSSDVWISDKENRNDFLWKIYENNALLFFGVPLPMVAWLRLNWDLEILHSYLRMYV